MIGKGRGRLILLAYQAEQILRHGLKDHDFQASWSILRRIFAGQHRVTATFRQKDGRTLHVHTTTAAKSKLQRLYETLGLSVSPGGVRKMVG